MTERESAPSARQEELLERAYRYVLDHGLTELSLRPLAAEIGSSPRVLLYLYGSKDGLVRALLARARADELALLDELGELGQLGGDTDVATAVESLWRWLADPAHRPLLCLWVDAYARSLLEPEGAWAGFAQQTVDDWLKVLAAAQPANSRRTRAARNQRTLALAVLRGSLLDLLATNDRARTSAAIDAFVATVPADGGRRRSRRAR
jgi:AcrR family transcriptional regulator